ncbi:MAG: SprT-like family protein [Candidatus Hodarchaeota archaeon]
MTMIRNSPEEVIAKTRSIYQAMLRNSKRITQGNFTKIGVTDLERLFSLYDRIFFSGLLQELLHRKNSGILQFRLSKRMARVGGKTTRTLKRLQQRGNSREVPVYEIAISAQLLFQTFKDVKRTVIINGIICKDRLEALQRIFEHELIHILEMVLWGKSSCSKANFRSLARQIFAHTDINHQLVTQREIALVNFGIGIGDKVSFKDDGKLATGYVNRITKRATILVESEKGAPYSNGKRYIKYYVPISDLQKEA